MKTRKFSLSSLVGWLCKKRAATVVVLPSKKRGSTTARDRVRSGIEPLEGRIAPAILLNAHTLAFNDADGDKVTITFSRDIFDLSSNTLPAALKAVFKFSTGEPHTGSATDPDDGVNQQLRLIDLSAVPTKLVRGVPQSQVAGVSFTVTSVVNPASGLPAGDGFAAVGAVKAGDNALGTVIIDGDLGQIDAGTGTSKVGLGVLVVQSIGKFGTTTQAPLPAPELTSEIKGRLGRLVVNEDLRGYVHAIDSTRLIGNVNTTIQRGTIGQITIGGSLIGNATVAVASDNTGRIESSYDIGNVRIGTDGTEGIFGGGGKNSGSIFAIHALGNVRIAGSLIGGTAEGAGAIGSGGIIGTVSIGGDVKGGTGANSGFVATGSNLGAVHIFGNIAGGRGGDSGKVFANGSIESVIVDGDVAGATAVANGEGIGSGAVEALRSLGPVLIGGDLAGGDGSASGFVAAGSVLARITVLGDVTGGKGVNSGAIFGGHDPASPVRKLGNVTINGALAGGEGSSSGIVHSGGTIAAVIVGAGLTTGSAIQGGIGALSGTIFAHGNIASVIALRTVTGSTGAGSASIQSEGTIGLVSITGNLAGGTGVESASIFAHENATAARPVAGNIGVVSITGGVVGGAERSALIEADGALGRAIIGAISGGIGADSASIITGAGLLRTGPTASISVRGLIEAGQTGEGATIHLGSRLGSLTAGGIHGADIRVAQDLGTLRVNGDVFDSSITARGQAAHGVTTDLAIGSITITGDVLNSRILAGYDLAGGAVNADAQIGAVRVVGNWTSSVLAAGVIDGGDDLFGTLDDLPIPVANSARIVAQIASIIIDGNVVGTAGPNDQFGFISQRIGSFKSGGVALPLNSAGGQSFEIGANGDTTVREAIILR